MSARAAIYLDANAGLAPLPVIRDGIREVLPLLHNPSSSHGHGRAARALITRARAQVTRSLHLLLPGLPDGSWIFTSGGTEAIQGVLRAASSAGVPRIAQAVEHSASLSFSDQRLLMPLDLSGRVDVDGLDALLRTLAGRPFLASLLWVNNETGVIQHRLAELCRKIKTAGGLVLLDGAQALGKLEANLDPDCWDFFTASAHKLGGLPGTGLLAFSQAGQKLLRACPVFSGSQQGGLRAGTENALGAWAFGMAAEADAWSGFRGPDSAGAVLRDELAARIADTIPGAKLHAAPATCIHNTLSIGFEGISARAGSLVDRLDLDGFSVSAGSACSSGVRKPSHVLKALGCSDELALASLRISLPPGITQPDLNAFAQTLSRAVEFLRGVS